MKQARDSARAAGLSAALVDGYTGAGGVVDPRALCWFRACAGVRHAMQPFRVLRPGWPVAARELLDAAEVAVGEAGL